MWKNRNRFFPLVWGCLLLFLTSGLTAKSYTEELRTQVFEYLRNPQGMSIFAGYGQATYANYFFENTNFIGLTVAQDVDQLLFLNAKDMQYFKLGLSIGSSYVNIRVAPNMAPAANIFYLEAESGVWAFGPENNKKPISLDIGIEFFGSMISFNPPLITYANVTNFLPREANKINGGWGVVLVGTGIPIKLTINLGKFVRISGGVYGRMGVALPVSHWFHSLTISYGIIGPEAEIFVIPPVLSLYFKFRPYASCYDMRYWEAGIVFRYDS